MLKGGKKLLNPLGTSSLHFLEPTSLLLAVAAQNFEVGDTSKSVVISSDARACDFLQCMFPRLL